MSFIGSTFRATLMYPNFGSIFTTALNRITSVGQTVLFSEPAEPGGELPEGTETFDIAITASEAAISFHITDPDFWFGGRFARANFNGYHFADVGDTLPDIVGVRFGSSTGMASGTVGWDAESFHVNMAGVRFRTGDRFELVVTFAEPDGRIEPSRKFFEEEVLPNISTRLALGTLPIWSVASWDMIHYAFENLYFNSPLARQIIFDYFSSGQILEIVSNENELYSDLRYIAINVDRIDFSQSVDELRAQNSSVAYNQYYIGADGEFHQFSLEHVLLHEFIHLATGLRDIRNRNGVDVGSFNGLTIQDFLTPSLDYIGETERLASEIMATDFGVVRRAGYGGVVGQNMLNWYETFFSDYRVVTIGTYDQAIVWSFQSINLDGALVDGRPTNDLVLNILVELGSGGPSTIRTGGGDDTVVGIINGPAVLSVIDLGPGDDRAYALAGDDSVTGDGGDDHIDGGDGADTLLGGEDDDTLIGGADPDQLFGEDGNDSLSGGTGNDSLDGGAGADVLRGEANADDLHGGDGADTLNGGAGADLLSGGADNDVVVGGTDNDTLDGGDGDDSMRGEAGDDSLAGGTGRDLLNGGADRDDLSGGDGDDTLIGGTGDDVLSGGGGVDTASYAGTIAALQVNLGLAGPQNTLGSGIDAISGVENLTGGLGADTLVGDAQANRIDGAGGDDLVNGAGGDDLLVLGAGNDIADGAAGMDTLLGGAGADRLNGGADADRLEGGEGDDTLLGGAGDDLLLGGAGVDTASYAGVAAPLLVDLTRTVAQNTLSAGIDLLLGVENLTGGLGGDVLLGNGAANRIDGGGGDDLIEAAGGADFVLGGDGDDRLDGGAGDDVMFGGPGADRLTGGEGSDTLTGGAGNDVFLYLSAAHSTGAAGDVIVGFQAAGALEGDLIDLALIDADAVAAGRQAFAFGTLQGRGRLWAVDDAFGTDTLIFGEIDGVGAADFSIRIVDGVVLAAAYSASDFIV